MQSQVRFNWEALVAKPGQVQQGSGGGEGLGGIGAEARSGPTGFQFRRKSGRLWCREGSAKVPGNLGAKPSKVQLGSGESSGESA